MPSLHGTAARRERQTMQRLMKDSFEAERDILRVRYHDIAQTKTTGPRDHAVSPERSKLPQCYHRLSFIPFLAHLPILAQIYFPAYLHILHSREDFRKYPNLITKIVSTPSLWNPNVVDEAEKRVSRMPSEPRRRQYISCNQLQLTLVRGTDKFHVTSKINTWKIIRKF